MNNTKLSKEQIERYMDDVISVVQQIAPNKSLLRAFLRDIFTPAEYRDVALRWRIITMLHQGVLQRDIVNALGVSLVKVTRGSRELMDSAGGFSQVLNRK